MEICYWSDYACPFCYIGETNLKAALRELAIDCRPEMRSFELSPDGPRTCPGPTKELVARKYGFTDEQAEASMQRINEMAADAGIPFDFGKTRYTSTLDAHRLTKYAQTLGGGLAEALTERLFHAGFCACAELADPEVLLSAALEVGLEEAPVREVLASDEFTDAVRSDEQKAHAMGVTGVPFFVIDGKYAIPGAMSKPEIVGVLQKILNRALG